VAAQPAPPPPTPYPAPSPLHKSGQGCVCAWCSTDKLAEARGSILPRGQAPPLLPRAPPVPVFIDRPRVCSFHLSFLLGMAPQRWAWPLACPPLQRRRLPLPSPSSEGSPPPFRVLSLCTCTVSLPLPSPCRPHPSALLPTSLSAPLS
jgi:hypothetical protein